MIQEFETIATIARELTVTSLLVLGVLAFVKGWVVTRPHHDEVKQELVNVIAFQREVIRKLRNGENP